VTTATAVAGWFLDRRVAALQLIVKQREDREVVQAGVLFSDGGEFSDETGVPRAELPQVKPARADNWRRECVHSAHGSEVGPLWASLLWF
jgi:hypothetical protein